MDGGQYQRQQSCDGQAGHLLDFTLTQQKQQFWRERERGGGGGGGGALCEHQLNTKSESSKRAGILC